MGCADGWRWNWEAKWKYRKAKKTFVLNYWMKKRSECLASHLNLSFGFHFSSLQHRILDEGTNIKTNEYMGTSFHFQMCDESFPDYCVWWTFTNMCSSLTFGFCSPFLNISRWKIWNGIRMRRRNFEIFHYYGNISH